MVNVNIDDKIWIPFLMQSVNMRKSASLRIREFIVGELKQKQNKGTKR